MKSMRPNMEFYKHVIDTCNDIISMCEKVLESTVYDNDNIRHYIKTKLNTILELFE